MLLAARAERRHLRLARRLTRSSHRMEVAYFPSGRYSANSAGTVIATLAHNASPPGALVMEDRLPHRARRDPRAPSPIAVVSR